MRTMKAMKYISAALLTALVAVAAGCSADRELPELTGNTAADTPENSQTLVLTVGTPTDESTQTRVAYDDANLKLTWQTGDQLTVAGFDAGGTYKGCSTDFTYKGKDNKTSGPFEGTAVSGTTKYTIYYPNTVQVDEKTGYASLPMEGQMYDAQAPTAGLKNYILLKSANPISPNADFTLTMASSIMKFDLSNIPAEVGKLVKLAWILEGGSGGAQTLILDFPAGAVTFGTGGGSTLTAYLGFMPSSNAMTKFTVMLIGDKIYQQEVAMAGGKTYTAGSIYTATMAGEWTECEQMKMTVNVDDTNGLDFNIPFPGYKIVPANTVVDWGDGSSSVIPQGNRTASNDAFNHTYSQAGAYVIAIASGKAATEQQILQMSFYSYKTEGDNAKKLVSMDTPLLNMNTTSLQSLFFGCSNLSKVSVGLFDKNTAVTNFQYCFRACSSLTEIPGLFDKNTTVTNFSYCFYDCSNLTTIPDGLFDKNTAVTDFGDCFYGCSLKKIPAGLFDKNTVVADFGSCFSGCHMLEIPARLFDKNTAVTDFSYCFFDCSLLEVIPAGLFDKNTAVTDFRYCFYGCSLKKIPTGLFDKNTAVTDFNYCFYGCSNLTIIPAGLFDKNIAVTGFGYCFYGCASLTAIPAGLFDKNTAATDFGRCFYDCRKATLNKNIFSTSDNHDRFQDKKIEFRYCFYNVGCDVSPAGEAPELWNYEKGRVEWTTDSCFTGANFTNRNPQTNGYDRHVKFAWGTPKGFI